MESMLHKIFHINQAGDIVQTYPFLPGKELWFGSYKDADIVVQSSRVAAHHLKIVSSGLKVIAEPQEKCDACVNDTLITEEIELQTDDIISIGGCHYMFYHFDHFNDTVEKHTDPVTPVVKIILEKDTNTRESTTIPEEKVEAMDDHIHKLCFGDVESFLGEVHELLTRISEGSLANWRHDVMEKENRPPTTTTKSDNVKIWRHNLIHHVRCGDFNDEFIDDIMRHLSAKFKRRDEYNNNVLLPTILRWIVMVSYEVDGKVANYYLENGGSNKAEAVEKEFLYKIRKDRSKRKIKESVTDDESEYIPSSASSGDDQENMKDSLLEPLPKKKGLEKASKKEKKPCPECGKELSNLPRHMKTHDWEGKKASKVVTNHGLRKAYQWQGEAPQRSNNPKPQKDYHVKKCCPFNGCWYVGVKVGRHLQSNAHDMDPKTDEYKDALKAAQPFSEKGSNDSRKKTERMPSEQSNVESTMSDRFEDSDEEVTNSSENAIHTNTYEDKLKLFLNYLMSPDGGRCDPKSSLQAVQEVRTVIQYLDGNILNIVDSLKLRDEFFRDNLDKKCKPATSKHYIRSLIKFMDFAISEEITLPPCTADDFTAMKLRLHNWRKSYNKSVDEQQWDNMEDEIGSLVTPEQVQLFENGELARSAIKIFGIAVDDDLFTPSILEYTTTRDYLITKIALLNAHRSGVSANMIVEEFNNHETNETEGNVIIRVRNHKTFRKHGYAHICIPIQTFNFLKIFIKLRKSTSPSCENVFVTWRGKPMSSGGVSKQINSIWKRSGVYGDKAPPKKNIGTTVIRKSVTSLVHENHMEQALPVADLLAHSLTTAGKHYRRKKMEKQATIAANTIQKVFHGSNNVTSCDTKSSENSTLRRAWSDEEVSVLKENFRKEEILLDVIRERLPSLKLEGRTVKQVYDKLRNMNREEEEAAASSPPTDLPVPLIETKPEKPVLQANALVLPSKTVNLPSDVEKGDKKVMRYLDREDLDYDVSENEESSIIATSSTVGNFGKNKLFDSNQSARLRKLCKEVISRPPISFERIKLVLKESEEGREFLEKFSLKQIQNKLKYERKTLCN